jgi:hypothetical protein
VSNRPVADRKSGMPAETEMPAPAITTILRFLCKTLSRRCSCGSSSSSTLDPERSRYSAVRSLGSAVFLLFAGRGLSSWLEGGEGMPSDAVGLFASERRPDGTCFVCRRWVQEEQVFGKAGKGGEMEVTWKNDGVAGGTRRCLYVIRPLRHCS